MPELQPEPEKPKASARVPQKPQTGGDTTTTMTGGGGGSPPPLPPVDYNDGPDLPRATHLADEAARRAREARYRVRRLLALLAGVAVTSVGAGVLVDNDVFWGLAGLAFLASLAGLITYATEQLGMFSQTAGLIAVLLRRPSEGAGGDGDPASEEAVTQAKSAGISEVALEFGDKLSEFGSGDDDGLDGDEEWVLEQARSLYERAAAEGSLEAGRKAGDVALRLGSQTAAASSYYEAAKKGNPRAAFALGRLHAEGAVGVASNWIVNARKDGALAAYVLARNAGAELETKDETLPDEPRQEIEV